jgi:hypothetical protein
LDKGRVVGILTVILGLYASWKIINLSTSLGAEGLNELLLVQVTIALCAFIGGAALLKTKIVGYLLALVAWAVELISGISTNVGQDSSSYFITISGILSVIVIGVLIYGIAQRLLRKNT